MWDQIFSWIDLSDLVIVLITGNTITRGISVGNEVGHAKAKNKTIIPLVSLDVPTSELGFLSGITYQPIDPANPNVALEEITKVVLHYKEKKKNDIGILFLLIGAIVGLFFISKN